MSNMRETISKTEHIAAVERIRAEYLGRYLGAEVEIKRLRAENAELRLAKCEFDKCDRMRAALFAAERAFQCVEQAGDRRSINELADAPLIVRAALGIVQQQGKADANPQ